jgi:predicted O-methyltransferase YrrM
MKKWQEVEGWIHDIEIKALQSLCKDKVCLEIGSYKGKSTLGIAEVAKKVYACDTFSANGSGQFQMNDLTTFDEFKQNIVGYENIIPCVGKSIDVVPKFEDKFFDTIFIDGMHDYYSAKTDIEVSWPKLKMNGFMAFHDYGWDGVNDGGPKKAIHTYFQTIKGPFFSVVYVQKLKETLL